MMQTQTNPQKLVCTINFDGTWAYMQNKLPPLVHASLRESLSYVDKKISLANKFRKWSQDPTVCLYDSNRHRFPTGLLPRVHKVLTNNNILISLNKTIPGYTAELINLPEWLFDHQIEIIKRALAAKRGMVESPTGSGKTIAAAYYLACLKPLLRPDDGRPQLIMTVPTIDLLKKTVETLSKHLNEPIGTVSGLKKQYHRITVGVIKSLANQAKTDPGFFSDVIGICYDEVHLAASATYKTFSNACVNTDFRLGLTGTLLREAGDDLEMEAIVGPAIHFVKESQLYDTKENNGVIIKPEYLCIPIPDPRIIYPGAIPNGYDHKGNVTYKYKTPNEKPPRDLVYTKCVVENHTRNQIIIDLIKAFLSSKRRVGNALVLVEHIAHGILLSDLATQHGIDMPFIHGTTPVKERDRYTELLVSGQQDVLCASRIFNMGTDIPRLEFLVIASGGRAETRVVQQFGRTTRQAKDVGKTRAITVDFADEERYYLSYNFRHRSRAIESRYPGSKKIMKLKEVLALL